jgi:hypothetical protein
LAKKSPDAVKLDSEKDKELIDVLKQSDYPGLKDAVCLILLDEMNLAHPELYFAEFLSKLELRRGKKGEDVPFLPVKIGAGMPAYQLSLGRNVLWTGTMNQDETTKSLSDKVLDRSIIIHFPRPTELKSREVLKNLADTPFTALHRKTWESWWVKKVDFEPEVIMPFRKFIEEINTALAASGRAIGHRAWQSVEYYMANYPDVRAAQQASDNNAFARAMHTAFEDQLVQKVMPKLRGIDTRGKSKTECLDKIRGQLVAGIGGNPFNLAEDFDLACELGYGQFIWQSANYLSKMETTEPPSVKEAHTVESDDTDSIKTRPTSSPVVSNATEASASVEPVTATEFDPPATFMPDDPSRKQKWGRLSDAKKHKYLTSESEDTQ